MNRRRIPNPLTQLRDMALFVAIVAGMAGGLIGYAWGWHSRQDVVFAEGYRACQAEQAGPDCTATYGNNTIDFACGDAAR